MTTTIARPATAPARRGSRLRWSLAILITLIGIAVGVAEYSPVLGVRQIAVQGERQVTAQQVLTAAAIKRGTPLLRLNKAAIISRIEAFPAVRNVQVLTSLPSSVRIVVIERVPVAYRPIAGGYQILDADNVAFRNQAALPKTVPLIAAPAGTAQAAAAVTVAASLPPAVLTLVASIAVPTAQTITMTLTDGRVVLWGGTDQDSDKARLLPVLLTQPGGYFDLSDPQAVISRPAA
jgi:cell division protein FtsQ